MAQRMFLVIADDDDRDGAPETPWTVNVYPADEIEPSTPARAAAITTGDGEAVAAGFGATVLDAIREAFEPGADLDDVAINGDVPGSITDTYREV